MSDAIFVTRNARGALTIGDKKEIDKAVWRLHRHVQLVLTDRSSLTAGRDYGVLSGRTWRLADLGAKQSMLLAGLGWGNMPSHLVQDAIAQGRLKVIRPIEFDSRVAQLVMCGAYLADRRPGPAGQWMIEHLSAVIGS